MEKEEMQVAPPSTDPADYIEPDYLGPEVTAETLLMRLDVALDTIHCESMAAEYCRKRLQGLV